MLKPAVGTPRPKTGRPHAAPAACSPVAETGPRPNRVLVSASGLRVAVVSLQRLGDVLTAARVTDGYARRSNVETVDVLHWDRTTQAAKLLPGVNALHPLPFSALRGRARVHPLAAFKALSAALELLEERYDVVVNLSSTPLACLLAPLLCREGGTMRGPWIDDQRVYDTTDPVVAHLNDWGVEPEVNVFAHRDLYALAAKVRLFAADLLPPDPAAETLCDQLVDATRPAPIAVHIHGSEPSKSWRDLGEDGWCGLIRRLRQEFDREVLLLGGPTDLPELERLAGESGATVAACSLRHTAVLLGRCAGLVSVDTVAIHLAAAAGCKNIVLRQGSARGHAFLPGTGALLVDHEFGPASVSEVTELCRAHFFDRAAKVGELASASTHVRVRECYRDNDGLLGAASPSWFPATAAHRLRDEIDRRWRAAWARSFFYEQPSDRVLRRLLRHRADDPHRFARVESGSSTLSRWLRDAAQTRGRAA